MRLLRKSAAALGVAALIVGPAIGAGLWETLPQIGQTSFCASTVTGTGNLGGITGTGQGTLGSICAQTVPAGPPSITGQEIVPADLYPGTGPYYAGGPTTAMLEMQQLSAGYTYQAINSTNQATIAAAGANFQVPKTALLLLDPTGTVANLTLQFPLLPLDGDHLRIASTQTITSLVITPGVNTQVFKGNKPTTLATAQAGSTSPSQASVELEFLYDAALTAWYRLQ